MKSARNGVFIIYGSLLLALLLGLGSSSITARFMTVDELGLYRFLLSSNAVIAGGLTFGAFSTAGTLLAHRLSARRRRLIGQGAYTHGLIVAVGCSVGVGSVFWLDEASGSVALLILASVSAAAMAWPLLLQERMRAEGGFVGIAVLNCVPTALFICFVLVAKFIVGASFTAAMVGVLYFLSQGIVSILLLLRLRLVIAPSYLSFRYIFRCNRSLGINIYWASILGILTAQVGIFSLRTHQSLADVAVFSLGVAISAPLSMLASSVGTAYFRYLPGSHGFPPGVLASTWVGSLVVLLVYIFFAPLLVDFLFGDKYIEVSAAAQICGGAAILQGVGDVYNRYYLANRHARFLLAIAIGVCIVAVVVSFLFAQLWGYVGVSAARLVSSGLYVLIFLVVYHARETRLP